MEEKELSRVRGIISKFRNYEETDDKPRKYYIRLENDDRYFFGFGSCPGVEGDEVNFEYETNPQPDGKVYYNIKRMESVLNTHDTPNTGDFFEVKSHVAEKTLGYPYVDIMRMAVDLCIERHDLGDKQIMACFTRLVKMANLYQDYIQKTKLSENKKTEEE